MPLNVYQLSVDNLDYTLLTKCIRQMPQSIKNKLIKINLLQNQWRIILTELLIKEILGKELKQLPNSLRIEKNKFGKPFLIDHNRQFNLAHSEKIVVLATDETPIGIDIEYVTPLPDLITLLSNFSEDEQKILISKKPKEQLDYFYDLWTLKESFLKAIGRGLSCSMKSFTITISKNSEISFLEPFDLNYSWHFKHYTLGKKYKCAICSQHTNFPSHFNVINAYDLIKSYI